MIMSEEFKALSETRQIAFMELIRFHLNAGFNDEQILTIFDGLDEKMIKEMIGLVKMCEALKKSIIYINNKRKGV